VRMKGKGNGECWMGYIRSPWPVVQPLLLIVDNSAMSTDGAGSGGVKGYKKGALGPS
jgi:hypothetical protein